MRVGDEIAPVGTSDRREVTRRHAFHSLRVVDIVEETADTRTLTFDIPAELEDLYRYEPGQFCAVRGTVDGQMCGAGGMAPAIILERRAG